ncbi:substrate-binding periplasmic protein [Marinobacter salicampi]|uniref:substrate-binding periplasmic protein n=1 Tax=Marinobacter salicampi TaxID=435907 RepID=UPI001F5EC5BE|nr:transporter substrate-binding domain-containing protein [Marinobacter salicampi]
MKLVIMLTALITALAICSNANAQTQVVVGAYNFPPIAVVQDSGQVEGLLAELLTELNERQGNYTFVAFATSPKRRHRDFADARYDVIFFESDEWNWDSVPHQVTRPILKDEEVYIALDKPDRGQDFFDDIRSRRIVAMLGYHYGFTDGVTDEAELRERFDIELSHSHHRNIELILADRPSVAEVAVVSRSYLSLYFRNNPDQRDEFLVSHEVDQSYLLHAIARPDSPVSAESLEDLIDRLMEDGVYQALVRSHGLQLP